MPKLTAAPSAEQPEAVQCRGRSERALPQRGPVMQKNGLPGPLDELSRVSDIKFAFAFGLRIAAYLEGRTGPESDGGTGRMMETLWAVSKGDLTLFDTPEETARYLRGEVPDDLDKALNDMRTAERRIAQILLGQ